MSGFTRFEPIDRSPDTLFRYLSNPDHLQKILSRVVQLKQVDRRPLERGSRLQAQIKVGRLRIKRAVEVSRYLSPSQLALTTRLPGMSVTYYYLVHPRGDGVRLTLVCDVEAYGLWRLLAFFLSLLLQRLHGDQLIRCRRALSEQGE